MAFPARVAVCELVSPSPVSGPIARADHPSAASPLPAGVVSSPSRQLPSTPVTDTTTTLQELLRSEETIPAHKDSLQSGKSHDIESFLSNGFPIGKIYDLCETALVTNQEVSTRCTSPTNKSSLILS